MSKVTQPPDIGRIKEQKDFNRNSAIVFNDVVSAINGNLDFATNFNCVFVEAEIQAGEETSITHNLGRVPVGHIVYRQTCQDVIYDGETPWDAGKIYVTSTSSGNAKMILF